MLWLIISLLTALAVASQDAWVKKQFSHLTAYDMLAFPFLFSLPLFFSFSAVIGKKGIMHSSPLFFTMTFFAVLSFLTLVALLALGKIHLKTFRDDWAKGLVAGALFFVHALSHGLAISMVKASYMISVKRFSALIGIIYGGLFFNEKYVAVRLMGAGLMVAGAVLISIWGK